MPDSPNNLHSPDRDVAGANVDSSTPPPRKLKITLPGYKLGKVIARGGQAVVIKATQESSGRAVAIKLLREGPIADVAARSRLQREVAVLATLKHPNIVSVIDHGVSPEGVDYIVMDFVDGKLLYDFIQAQSEPLEPCLPLSGLLKIFTSICAAMHAAHLHGIVHRDLCPANIMIDAQEEPHILDFGLARTAFDQYIGGGLSKSSTGQFIGKPQYASPEQARGEPEKIDIRTDVYALGIILYQILTGGEFPYSVTGNFVEVLGNIVHQAPIPPSKQIGSREIQKRNPGEALAGTRRPAGVTRVLEAIVMKAIEKDPQNRYQSAGELGHDIENYLTGKPTIAHRESTRFDATDLPPEFTQWRIVLAGAAIVTLCVWAIFHFANVLPDFGSSSEDIQPSDAMKVATRMLGPPIDPSTPHGSAALSGPTQPPPLPTSKGPGFAPRHRLLVHQPISDSDRDLWLLSRRFRRLLSVIRHRLLGRQSALTSSENSNPSELKTPTLQSYGPPMGVSLSPQGTNDLNSPNSIISANGIVIIATTDGTLNHRITTAGSFKPPVEINIVAKTDSTDLRLAYAADQVIFNWSGNSNELRVDGGPANGRHKSDAGSIPINKYVYIRWVVTPKGQAIYVDDKLRYVHFGDYSRIDQPVSVFPARGSTVTVKSIQVRRLGTDFEVSTPSESKAPTQHSYGPPAALPPFPPMLKGGVGVGTWATKCEYKDMTVMIGDKVLYALSPTQEASDWKIGAGDSHWQGGVLRQASYATDCRATVGDQNWTDYTYTLKAKKYQAGKGS